MEAMCTGCQSSSLSALLLVYQLALRGSEWICLVCGKFKQFVPRVVDRKGRGMWHWSASVHGGVGSHWYRRLSLSSLVTSLLLGCEWDSHQLQHGGFLGSKPHVGSS